MNTTDTNSNSNTMDIDSNVKITATRISIRKAHNVAGYHSVVLVLGTGHKVAVGMVRKATADTWTGTLKVHPRRAALELTAATATEWRALAQTVLLPE